MLDSYGLEDKNILVVQSAERCFLEVMNVWIVDIKREEKKMDKKILLLKIRELSDSKEHETNGHYLGYEEAIDDVLKLVRREKA